MSITTENYDTTDVKHNSQFKTNSVTIAKHVGYCLACKKQLSVCGKPFTDTLRCRSCGSVNVYRESQQPTSLAAGVKGQFKNHSAGQQHGD